VTVIVTSAQAADSRLGGTTDANRTPTWHDNDDRGAYHASYERRSILVATTHLHVIDRSIEKTHIWINDLAEELGTDDGHHAYRVLRAFLHALRDHLPVNEAAQLAAQLPIFVRGVFYEGWDPSRTPEHARDLDSFLQRIASEAALSGETEASFCAVAASRVLRRHVSAGEGESVLHALPHHLRELLGTDAG
jgi:uncharacterized protein (DUF2267 family)